MDLTEIRSNMFRADEIYYDLGTRNRKVLDDLSDLVAAPAKSS